MDPEITIDIQEIYEYIHSHAGEPERQPGEITIAEYAERAGVSYDAARMMFNKLVGEGKLTSRFWKGHQKLFRKA